MIIQSFKMAWKSISGSKMRSFLTMLGIIIGVSALVVLVSIVNGATGSVKNSINSMGSNYLTVSILDDKENPIRLSELNDFAESEEIDAVAPIARSSFTAKSGYTSGTINIYGTTGAYFNIMNLSLYSGRYIKNVDVTNNSNVIILNYDAAVELLGRADCVGESVSIDGRSFLIIGVLENDDTNSDTSVTSGSSDSETTVTLEGYIPYTTLTRIADNILYITQFYASATNSDTLDYAETALENELLERLGNDSDAFTVFNQSSIMEAMQSVTETLSLMLGGIASISLLVGGIGIMNIMLVSVTERTKEIGIRKAIGAGRGTIMAQFLIEALMISLIGCLIGIILSWIILQVISHFVTTSTFELSGSVAFIATIFSLAIGVIFGLYPANKAAKKKPIDALRFGE